MPSFPYDLLYRPITYDDISTPVVLTHWSDDHEESKALKAPEHPDYVEVPEYVREIKRTKSEHDLKRKVHGDSDGEGSAPIPAEEPSTTSAELKAVSLAVEAVGSNVAHVQTALDTRNQSMGEMRVIERKEFRERIAVLENSRDRMLETMEEMRRDMIDLHLKVGEQASALARAEGMLKFAYAISKRITEKKILE